MAALLASKTAVLAELMAHLTAVRKACHLAVTMAARWAIPLDCSMAYYWDECSAGTLVFQKECSKAAMSESWRAEPLDQQMDEQLVDATAVLWDD